jgi:hypothetical protein
MKTIGKQAQVNIASEFNKKEVKLIVDTAITDYEFDIDSRKDWEEKRNRYYKLWSCFREQKDTPWVGASNVCIPMLASATNQFHARAYQSIFAAPGVAKTIPVGESDIKRAKNTEAFLNWQLLYDMEEYEDVSDRTLQLLPINGTAVKKLTWDKENERPESHFISVLDFVVPYGTKSLKTCRRQTHRLWYHKDEIEDRIDSGFYDEVKEEIPEAAPEYDNPGLKKDADAVSGEEASRESDKPQLVLEQHRYWKVKGEKKPVIFWVHKETRQLLRAVVREYKLENKTITMQYFIDYHFIPNPEGWYSFGFGHFLEPLNEMANTAFNQIFDSGRLSNQPFGFYSRRAGFKTRKIKLAPGGMYEVEDATAINFPNMQRVDQVLFMVLGLIQQYAEQFTSATELMSGRQQKGVKTPTATGTMAVIEQGLITFAVLTKRILRSVRAELRLIMTLNQLYLSDKKQFRVMESSDKIVFKEVKKEDFSGVHDVIPQGDPSFSSRMMRRQEAMELYQVLIQNPLVAQNPKALHALTSDLLDTYEKRNRSAILPDLPEEMVSPMVENAMIAEGELDVKPKPGEDHKAHLMAHLQFTQTDLFKSSPKEYREAMTAHIQETQLIAAVEIEQSQIMGSVNVPPAPTGQMVNAESPAPTSPGGLM